MSAASMLGSEADILGMRPAKFYCLLQKDVERELERQFPQYIDDESLLDIYTKWLVFQIPNLGHRSHEDSSETIRRGCDYLSSRNYNKGLVLSAFSRHKDRYVREHPEATRRRSNLAVALILTALFRTILIRILVETTLTVLMIRIVPARPVAPIFRFVVMKQIVRIIRDARTDVYPGTMTMTHRNMSLHIAVINCIVANLQVAGMSHAASSRRLAPMDHAKPLIRIILTDRGVARKRSDGRLSPWDDIHPPPKKPREQDAWEGGLPWDDFEAPQKSNKRDSADSPTAKHGIATDHKHAPNVNSKKAVPSLGYAKAAGESTDAEWEQAGTEANAFLEALGRELAECPELETSANLRNEGSSDSPNYSSASPVSSADQYHSPANPVPDGDEDSFMDDFLDDIAEPTRSMGCEIDEDQPCSDPGIIPFQTLKSLQRDPPYDSGVLNLFRCKKDSHVYINVVRRRNAVDLYTETEEERATVRMLNLAV
ncbi:uncharacterized protein LY79DRAFT_507967 [Colletotrichum navitas]|uniref:Uncharacterized protein n=1 Tax=Colletotrichum navitas TaxID=681940 RepID=A0AAD8V9Y6_9PEZI|nr:uncharacterized protein LY79DRAFT_507967 [Colletotrichum navitas]KAK1597321.1 hypothetical protein LY79DRAFT_507967 [Colletotrichum navitas]